MLSYLVNELSVRDRRAVYSIVAAVGPEVMSIADDEIVLTKWLTDRLDARAGDRVSLEYYLPESRDGVRQSMLGRFEDRVHDG